MLDARRLIAPYLDPTPLRRYPTLDEALDAEAFLKHEAHLPTGAFKVRGGINLVGRREPDLRAAGVCAASTGNHGQSVAYAASLFGVAATIFVPVRANPVKVAAIRSLGAEVVEHGAAADRHDDRLDLRLALEQLQRGSRDGRDQPARRPSGCSERPSLRADLRTALSRLS